MPPYPSAKKAGISYETIVRDVRAGNVKPVYYLMGEESYYIDRVADFIADSVLKPEERDFNMLTLFGSDATVEDVINAAKSFPMGAQRIVVMVKEAQALSGIDRLEYYLKQPQPSTVLILCHKNGTLDRRKKVAGMIEKTGVLFESKKVYESQLATFVRDYLKRKKCSADPAAIAMLTEYVGADLNRMAGELDKLCIALPAGEGNIDAAFVERHIGISKDFNIFELQDALAQKDAVRALRIVNYFDKNQKQNPIQKVLPALFRFFSNVMLAYYAPDRSERGVAAWLGQTEWQVHRNVMPAMQHYSGVKVMMIIGEIRRTDARSKGVDNPSTPPGELMRELLFFILH